jgi:hypothetical protein
MTPVERAREAQLGRRKRCAVDATEPVEDRSAGTLSAPDNSVVQRSGICLPPGVDRSQVDYATLIKTGSVSMALPDGLGSASPAFDSPSPPADGSPQTAAAAAAAARQRWLASEEARIQAAVHRKRRARRQHAWKQPQPQPQPQRPSQPHSRLWLYRSQAGSLDTAPQLEPKQPLQLAEPEPEPEPEPELEPELENPVYAWSPKELAQQSAVLKFLLVSVRLPFASYCNCFTTPLLIDRACTPRRRKIDRT